jgi:hypothetical protein
MLLGNKDKHTLTPTSRQSEKIYMDDLKRSKTPKGIHTQTDRDKIWLYTVYG